MPNKDKHIEQYKRNKSLANITPITDSSNNDWRITLIFYSIIHLLESSYAHRDIHFKTHVNRKAFIEKTKTYNNIIDDYENLEALSRKARYDCIRIKDKEVEMASKNMKNIENFIEDLTKSN